jgi:pimeloyl-ACP methyl ester carboxylesterase
VVTLDFLGFGASDKSHEYQYSFELQLDDLEAVADGLQLDRIIPVGHAIW